MGIWCKALQNTTWNRICKNVMYNIIIKFLQTFFRLKEFLYLVCHPLSRTDVFSKCFSHVFWGDDKEICFWEYELHQNIRYHYTFNLLLDTSAPRLHMKEKERKGGWKERSEPLYPKCKLWKQIQCNKICEQQLKQHWKGKFQHQMLEIFKKE